MILKSGLVLTEKSWKGIIELVGLKRIFNKFAAEQRLNFFALCTPQAHIHFSSSWWPRAAVVATLYWLASIHPSIHPLTTVVVTNADVVIIVLYQRLLTLTDWAPVRGSAAL